MPIQAYDNYQTNPAVRQGEARSGIDAAQAGLVGRQIAATGEALSGAGAQATDMFLKEREKQNSLLARDMLNKLSERAQRLKYDDNEGYLRLKGEAAVHGIDGKPIADWYDGELEKAYSELAAKVPNQAAREMFSLAANDLRARTKNEAIAYEGEQAAVYGNQVRDATIVNSVDLLARDPFGLSASLHVDDMEDAAIAKAEAAGLRGPGRDQAVKSIMGTSHTKVIDSLLDAENVKGAKAYFELHREDFMELDAKAVAAKLDTAVAADEAMDVVDSIWNDVGPKTTNDKLDAAVLDAEIRKRLKGDTAAIEAARKELNHRKSNWEFQENERNDSNVNGVWDQLLGGRSMAQVEGSRAWLALPGATRAQLKSQWEASQRVGSDEDKMTPEAQDVYDELMGNLSSLQAMTPQSIQALRPLLGMTITKQVRDEWKRLQEDGGLAAARLDNDIIAEYATRFGIKPYSSNDTDQRNTATVRARLKSMISAAQARKGNQLTEQETRDLVEREMLNIVTVPGWFGSKTKPAVTLTEAEAKKFKAPAGREKEWNAAYNKVQSNLTARGQSVDSKTLYRLTREQYLDDVTSGNFQVDE